jgi:hypothetical protein
VKENGFFKVFFGKISQGAEEGANTGITTPMRP